MTDDDIVKLALGTSRPYYAEYVRDSVRVWALGKSAEEAVRTCVGDIRTILGINIVPLTAREFITVYYINPDGTIVLDKSV